MSNEIKITPILPYSIAHSMFLGELAMLFRQTNEHKLPMMIEVIKNNWLLLNSRSRDIFIMKFQEETEFKKIQSVKYQEMLTEFITWANQNRDNTSSTPQPLNAFIELPVVNQKPLNKSLR